MMDPKMLEKLIATKGKMEGLKNSNPEAFAGMEEDYNNLVKMLEMMGHKPESTDSESGVDKGKPGNEDLMGSDDGDTESEEDKMMQTMVAVVKSGKDYGQGQATQKAVERMSSMSDEEKTKVMKMAGEKMKAKKARSFTPDLAALYGM